MSVRLITGIEYVAAVLHARRSRMAEGDRLGALCAGRTVAELARALYGNAAIASAVELQKRMVLDRANEILELALRLDGPGGELIAWMAVRFQVENLKVLARGLSAHTPASEVEAHLVPLPGDLAVDARSVFIQAPRMQEIRDATLFSITRLSVMENRVASLISAADSNMAEALAGGAVEAFVEVVGRPPLREAVLAALPLYRAHPRAFFLEAALDAGYFTELVARAGAVTGDERGHVLALVEQEINIFHLALIIRGKFHYGLPPEQLMPFCVAGAGARKADIGAMWSAPTLAEAAEWAAGFAPGDVPQVFDGSAIERMAWARYHRLAATTFRRSVMGLGLVAAYVALRRVELANLIAVSEGIRAGLSADDIRRCLIPCREGEARRV